MSWFRSGLLHAVLLVAVVVVLYGRTTGFGFSYVDDDRLIVDNQAFLTSRTAVPEAFGRPYFGHASDHAYFRPLVTVSFVLDAWHAGSDPGAYHTTNVFVHALAVVALLFLLRVLEHRGGSAFFERFSCLRASGAHGERAWIPGRTDLLVGLFAICSLSCWACAEHAGGRAWRAGCLALWFCALLSKETR